MESTVSKAEAGQVKPETDDRGPLSKNKLRKIRKYERKLEARKALRAVEKQRRKISMKEQGIVSHRRFRGNEEKCEAAERLQKALQTGSKVVIDCQYVSRMSLKEQKRFAQQIRRAYSSNRVAEQPLHLYLTSLPDNSDFFQICCQQNAGFANYVLDRTEKSVTDLFAGGGGDGSVCGDNNETCVTDDEQVVYLSPDSENVLTEFDPHRVYIIGGIVDETTKKNISKGFAEDKKITTARIPIDKYFTRGDRGTFKQVLTINQVVDIILEWHRSRDWVRAISAGLPQRTGSQLVTAMLRSVGSSANSSDIGWLEPNLEDVKAQFQKFEGGQITLTQDDQRGLAYICIDHEEKKNGISGKMMVELSAAVDQLEKWDRGKGLIVHSRGSTFCSGAYLDTVKKISAPEDGFRMSYLMQDTLSRLHNLPMLSVAVVQGLAIGGGAELCLSTDYRLFTPETEICFIQSKMGITTGWGGGMFLKTLVGPSKALEIFLKAKKINADEAFALGLANETVNSDTRLEEAVLWLKAKVNPYPASVVRAIKKNILCSSFQEERQVLASVWGGQAQLEKLSQNLKHK